MKRLVEANDVSTGTMVATDVAPVGNGDPRIEQLLKAVIACRDGDFSQRLPAGWTGVYGKVADAMNDILATSERRTNEVTRICCVVGKQGNLKQRISVPGAKGGWADEVQAINTLIDDLTWPTKEVTRAIGAVAKGDLGQ